MEKLARIACGGLLCTCAFLTACGPSEEKKAQFAEKKRVDCLDKFCEGDAVPKHDSSKGLYAVSCGAQRSHFAMAGANG